MDLWSRSRKGLVGLTLAVGAALPLAAQVKPSVDADDGPDPGYALTGEIREVAPGKITVCPWQARLPARVAVVMSPRTRLVRQRKGSAANLKVGELVLVVEKPANDAERLQRRMAATGRPRSKKQPKNRERNARARAVLRCGTPSGVVDEEERRSARALLEGALPFFKGEGRGGVRKPGETARLVVGTVTALEPFTVRSPRLEVKYSLTEDTLIIDHQEQEWSGLKRGQTVLVHSPIDPESGRPIEASVVAVSPKPRLKSDQQRKLLQRERKLAQD